MCSDTREPIGTVTISLGVSEWRASDTFDDLIARADEGLYKSKAAGRNRVTGELDLVAKAS